MDIDKRCQLRHQGFMHGQRVFSRGSRALKRLAMRMWRVVSPATFYASYWNERAGEIHVYWGQATDDYDLLRRIIVEHKVNSVLDVGCGSGRLFPLYQEMGIQALGVDISQEALNIASREHPDMPTTLIRSLARDLSCLGKHFDLAIAARTLQHVPRSEITEVITALCQSVRLVFLDELSGSDGRAETDVMFMHKYGLLLSACGFMLMEQGSLGKKTWLLFSARNEGPRP